VRIEIIVAADEPALFFSSVRSAEIALEWIDVRNGIYTAIFGRAGEVYEIGEDGGLVRIRLTRAEARPDELKALLLKFLDAAEGTKPDAEDLDQLLARCEPYRPE